jgi:hypothetical protein
MCRRSARSSGRQGRLADAPEVLSRGPIAQSHAIAASNQVASTVASVRKDYIQTSVYLLNECK